MYIGNYVFVALKTFPIPREQAQASLLEGKRMDGIEQSY